jgi:hypothetical protein
MECKPIIYVKAGSEEPGGSTTLTITLLAG